ncbi:malate synthase [Symbiobacterium terraclitae]|uniref:Malate synthase n=1 Tax=Symbiobacterium terraclitae TaxID=557451 RepID=A0ABS4JPT8_9FIRM|nr:malate synthase [Symbiobacterium terraclitae]
MLTLEGLSITGAMGERYGEVLTPEALAFLVELHRRFSARRDELLELRRERQERLDRGELPDFLPETRAIREAEWTVAPYPPDLADRRVEITGPVDRKMIINALNSGARVFMADFEDSTSPTWANIIEGQINLIDAVNGTISYTSPDGRVYRLKEKVATLFVRPRGWHLPERHIAIDGRPASGSLVDFGLFFFHNARRLLEKGSGPYFYLPKLESHLEARLWNDVFCFAQEYLDIPRGTIKATVLIETILAAFEMDEILYELREHSVGLNAGRWDYIFSCIKKFRNRPDVRFPDRSAVTMTVPFMRAYTELLVKTCHRRGTFAMGGMAAFIPSRRNPAVNAVALEKVRQDKEREANDGFDGTWVAHPDLVPVATAVFDEVLGGRPNQIDRQRPDVSVTAADLLNFAATPGAVTEEGLRLNLNVGIQYIESWLRGVGAAAIHNLMEDAATAEISRSQVWQWLRQRAALADGRRVTPELVRQLMDEELERIHRQVGSRAFTCGRFHAARQLFEAVAMKEDFPEFLTLPGYALI